MPRQETLKRLKEHCFSRHKALKGVQIKKGFVFFFDKIRHLDFILEVSEGF